MSSILDTLLGRNQEPVWQELGLIFEFDGEHYVMVECHSGYFVAFRRTEVQEHAPVLRVITSLQMAEYHMADGFFWGGFAFNKEVDDLRIDCAELETELKSDDEKTLNERLAVVDQHRNRGRYKYPVYRSKHTLDGIASLITQAQQMKDALETRVRLREEAKNLPPGEELL